MYFVIKIFIGNVVKNPSFFFHTVTCVIEFGSLKELTHFYAQFLHSTFTAAECVYMVWNHRYYLCGNICGLVDMALDARSKGLGFDSHCWSCVEVSVRLLIPNCLCLLLTDGYLVNDNCAGVAQVACILGLCDLCALYSQGGIGLVKCCVSYTRETIGRLNTVSNLTLTCL